ncbi:protein ImuB [Sphingobium sp. B1D7B]|uniref:Y-family DNA polymerase n=1 Tax=unclassified Sphingobium TaxID=2611147 RepID=UPI002224ABAF|nr:MULTISPECIES: DNA polymerase Y family protein [unclassified Sphingobium]MCW2393210.1 protein ImuB [Sphingobium sp. B11D3A]MCW2405092.1 protein ImuB [Sphingobium sp. B1D7B]
MTDACSVKRRYLALWFPLLPTERLRIQQGIDSAGTGGQPDGPLVLVAKIKGALRLCAVDAQARALGISPGQTLADARALQPDLIVADMDEEADRHWLQRLARHCIAWSPHVTLAPPDGITLDIAGSDHLFGGEAGLAAQAEDAFAAIGMSVRMATASTAQGAQALARHARLPVTSEREALRALPVLALGLDEEATLALRRAGLKTIGDLASRAAASIAARFGADAVTALRRLLGEEQAPIDPLAQPEPLHFERRFAEPVALQASIAACFLDLLREAARTLDERGLGGRRFVLTLFRSDGARHRLAIETGLPTRDPAPVLRLFDERIGTLADPLDPGFGYDRITLFLPVTEPLGTSQPALDGSEQDAGALADLIDRLSTRLGPASLCRLEPQDSHIPEQAQLALPAIHARAPLPWPRPPAGEPPLRPLFLFDPPQPVEVIAQVPDGPPHRFRWKRRLHEVRLYEGPERIASEWWRRKGGEAPGKAGLTRDYYRIEDVRGRRYWIFRHGLYDEKPDPNWYLHGLFA